ncbi:MAG TPA: helix-turn-helix domain-containing protein [Pseudonocardiaceae bacterium]|jgi:AcrR family transcriptional regulator|nr:helix-turn-helix domain-containing protein [Pseudonocardiaceae bacterium]
MTAQDAETKLLRANSRRNHDALLAAAREVFTTHGTDAPLDLITRQVGVGRGTLYRHFPTREHLFVAIMRDKVEELDHDAQSALAAEDVWAALTDWLRRYDRAATDYRGMSASVGDGLVDDNSPVAPLCQPMKASFTLLFERARAELRLRADVTAVQVLALVLALPKDPDTGRTMPPYLDIVLDGLR